MKTGSPYTLLVYTTTQGKQPLSVWLQRLKDRYGQKTIIRRLLRLREGLMGDTKSVGDGIYELRIDSGPGYRVYYALSGTEIIVLLVGGDKSSQRSDIRIAKQYLADYQARFIDADHDDLTQNSPFHSL